MTKLNIPLLEIPAFAAANQQAATDIAVLRSIIEGSSVSRADESVANLRAENEALRKDAELYRWIRDKKTTKYSDAYWINCIFPCNPALETFDDVVYAAMKEGK